MHDVSVYIKLGHIMQQVHKFRREKVLRSFEKVNFLCYQVLL